MGHNNGDSFGLEALLCLRTPPAGGWQLGGEGTVVCGSRWVPGRRQSCFPLAELSQAGKEGTDLGHFSGCAGQRGRAWCRSLSGRVVSFIETAGCRSDASLSGREGGGLQGNRLCSGCPPSRQVMWDGCGSGRARTRNACGVSSGGGGGG